MMLDFDSAVGGFASDMSFKVLPLAARSGLPGRASSSVHAQRLVADVTSTISMRRSQYESFIDVHDNQLNHGRDKFLSPQLQALTGADVLVGMFKESPRLTAFDESAGSLAISMRLLGRVVEERPFELCRYVLKSGFSVIPFSKSHSVELLGGDISRVGAYFGEQYTVECTLKLFQEDFKALLSWYLVTLGGGAKSFAAGWLGDADQRLSNKTVMLAGGLDCQFAQGVVNIKIKLWVVNDSVTIGVLGA